MVVRNEVGGSVARFREWRGGRSVRSTVAKLLACLGALVAFVGTPSSALAQQEVAVLPFTGPKSVRAREAVIDALKAEGYAIVPLRRIEDAADELNVDEARRKNAGKLAQQLDVGAVFAGKVSKRSKRRWRAEVEMFDRNGESQRSWSVGGSSHRKVYKRLRAGFAKRFARKLGRSGNNRDAAEEPEFGEEEVIDDKPPFASQEDDATASDEDENEDEDEDEDEQASGGASLTTVEGQAFIGSYSRRIGYNRGTRPNGNDLKEDSAAMYARIKYYPFASFGGSFLPKLGLELRGHFPFIFNVKDPQGQEFRTLSYGIGGGLRLRLPISKHEVAFSAGIISQSFRFGDQSTVRQEAFPDVQHVAGRFGIDGRYQLGKFSLRGEFAWMPVFSVGEFDDEAYAGDGKVGAFEFETTFGYALTSRLELQTAFWFRQYSASAGGGVGNPFKADLAVDRYFGFLFGVGFAFPKLAG